MEIAPVWATLSNRIRVTVYFTAIDINDVAVSWEKGGSSISSYKIRMFITISYISHNTSYSF